MPEKIGHGAVCVLPFCREVLYNGKNLGGEAVKTIIKIEIALLVVVALVATAMCLISAGALMWLKEPVVLERETVPIPTEAVMESQTPEEPETPAGDIADALPEAATPAEAAQSRDLTAKSYFIYDVREAGFLKQKGDMEAKVYPASITKLMTSYVLLQHMKPKDKVVVGADALALVHPDSSLAWLKIGDTLTVDQLIAAMMLPSGNDAAHVAAVAAGREIAGKKNLDAKTAEEAFLKEMNKQAKKLGMTGSHFVTPDGMHHDDHYTTAKDLITLSSKVLAEPTILRYTSRAQATAKTPTRSMTWKNTNILLNPESSCYIPSTIGLKTGYTDAAGNCLMSAFFMEDRLILIGVFGCPKKTMDRYLDTVDLYNSLL